MPLGSSLPFMIFTVLVWTLGEMIALPLMNAVVADRSSAANRGRYMGMITMAFSIAFMSAPLLGTRVYARFGPDALWYGAGALGIPLWIASVWLAKPLRRGLPSGESTGKASEKPLNSGRNSA